MYIPDYELFDFEIPNFSALDANDMRANTTFSASDPLQYVNRALNLLLAQTEAANPLPYQQRNLPIVMDEIPFLDFFQSPSGRDRRLEVELEVERARQAVLDAIDKAKRAGGIPQDTELGKKKCDTTKCIWWERWFLGKKDGECCHSVLKSDDSAGMATTNVGVDMFAALPKGSGIFIGVIAIIILLLLFAKK